MNTTSDMEITIGHLYPDLLNLYGDRGNVACMMKRCLWRGIRAKTIEFNTGDPIDFGKLDIVLLGGGSDREQTIVCQNLKKIREQFRDYVENNGVVIAVCGGYQLLGKYYQTGAGRIEGLSLLDICTEQGEGRMIGNIILKSELSDIPVVGFENHGGRTYLNGCRPFGRVLYGAGNDGKSDHEGVIYKNVIGTYLHGPLLPKNSRICDWLIEKALRRKYGPVRLAELDDRLERAANAYICQRFVKKNPVLEMFLKFCSEGSKTRIAGK